MSIGVINESIFWFSCFLAGIAITMVYDIIRAVRRVVRHNGFFIALEDVVFWAFVSVLLFLLLYHMNNGTVRWFAVFGLFVGMCLYKKIFGDFLVSFMSTILSKVLYIVVRLVSTPLKLVKRGFSKGFRLLQSTSDRVKNKLTGNIKAVKIILCKRKKLKKGKEHESKILSE